MQIANFLINLLGLFVFLFIFWKRLRDDYSNEIVFRVSTYIFLGTSIFYLISFNFFKDWFLWFSFIGGNLGLILGYYRFRVRYYESLEAMVVAGIPWVSLIFLSDSINKSSFTSFMGFIVSLVLLFISYWLDEKYKNFSWYKSGKIGITGLILLAIVFLIRSVVAFFELPVLSLVNYWEIYISVISFIISLSLIYILNKKE